MEMVGQFDGPAALSPREQASRAFEQSVFNDQRHSCLLSRVHAGRYEQLLSYRHAHRSSLYIVFCLRNIKLMQKVLHLQLGSQSQKIITTQSVKERNYLRLIRS